MKFRKKPVVVDAVRLVNGCDLKEICKFLGGEKRRNLDFSINYVQYTVTIHTLGGMMTAQPGDWIIKGVNGEFYPCKPDIFEKTYEPVHKASAPDINGECSECGESVNADCHID